eukprot:gene11078-7707_t
MLPNGCLSLCSAPQSVWHAEAPHHEDGKDGDLICFITAFQREKQWQESSIIRLPQRALLEEAKPTRCSWPAAPWLLLWMAAILWASDSMLATAGSVGVQHPSERRVNVILSGTHFTEASFDAEAILYPMRRDDGSRLMCLLPSDEVEVEGRLVAFHEAAKRRHGTVVPETILSAVAAELEGKCYQVTPGWWSFELCWGRFIRQFHAPEAEIVLGQLPATAADGAAAPALYGHDHRGAYISTVYMGGNTCDTTVEPRVTELRLYCGNADVKTSFSVVEVGTCKYLALLFLPEACAFHQLEEPSRTAALVEYGHSHGPSAPPCALTRDAGRPDHFVGNQVLSTFFRCTEREQEPEPPLLQCRLADGDVVTALAAAEGRDGAPALIVCAAADTVFWSPYDPSPPPAAPQEAVALYQSAGDRVVALRRLPRRDAFVAVTAAAAAILLTPRRHAPSPSPGSTLRSAAVEWATPQRLPAPLRLGVTLAADAVLTRAGGQAMLLRVFCGTYSGSVCEWAVAMPNAGDSRAGPPETSGKGAGGRQVSTIAAHSPSCAIFAVQALQNGHAVATCSDDRTAVVFVRSAVGQGGERWHRVWRGAGPEFSLSRVFAVHLAAMPPEEGGDLLVAAGSEDGSVSLFLVHGPPPPAAGEEPVDWSAVCVSRIPGQHSGHGARAVLVIPPPRPGGETKSNTPAAWLLSGGFDGTVVGRRVRLYRPPTAENPATVLRLDQQHGKDAVRCVVVTQDLHVLMCTQRAVWAVLPPPPRAAGEAPLVSDPYHIADITDDVDGAAEVEVEVEGGRAACGASPVPAGATALYPSTAAGAADAPMPGQHVALVATVGGEWLLLPYASPPTSAVAESGGGKASLHRSRSSALVSHRKCLALRLVVRRPGLLVVVSSHVDSSVVLSELVAPPSPCGKGSSCWSLRRLKVFTQGPGVRGASLCAGWSHSTGCCWAAAGDRDGRLLLVRWSAASLGSLWSAVKAISVQVFQRGMSVSTITPLEAVETRRLLLASDTGHYAEINLSDVERGEVPEEARGGPLHPTERPLCPHPALFAGSPPPSAVLCATARMWVARSGTRVFFSAAGPHHSWTVAGVATEVRAPRLLDASVAASDGDGVMACLAHCSDGQTVQIERVAFGPGAHGDAAASAILLYGGRMPGKDFNCCCALPSYNGAAPSFLMGNEDTTFVVHLRDGGAATSAHAGAVQPTLLLGAHHANILGVCALPPHFCPDEAVPVGAKAVQRAVTVGGAATLVVWARAGGQWRMEGLHYGAGGGATGTTAADAVPRFMAVCPISKDVVAVASSDACLRFLRLSHCGAAGTTEIQETAALVLDPSAPRPLLCVAPAMPTITTTNTAAAVCLFVGDSGGRVFAVETSATAGTAAAGGPPIPILAVLRIESCAVNAVSAAHPTLGGWEAAAISDSGTVHLVQLRRQDDLEGLPRPTRWSLYRSCTVSIGITAGRGIVWRRGMDLVAACEERVVRLRAADSAEGGRTLSVVRRRRNNVRGVSGLAVAEGDTPSASARYEVLVVGQGLWGGAPPARRVEAGKPIKLPTCIQRTTGECEGRYAHDNTFVLCAAVHGVASLDIPSSFCYPRLTLQKQNKNNKNKTKKTRSFLTGPPPRVSVVAFSIHFMAFMPAPEGVHHAAPTGSSSRSALVADVLRQLHGKRGRDSVAAPLVGECPLAPLGLWARVTRSAVETSRWAEREHHSAATLHRKLQKELTRFQEEANARADKERREQRASRARLSSRLHALCGRYWSRRQESFQQVMQVEFQTLKQFYDRQRQEDLLQETEALTKKLLDSMLHRRTVGAAGSSPWALDSSEGAEEKQPGNAASPPIESHLALLDTLNGQRPLRSYQRSALKWMIHLYESNLNGILADEMGLGKTVQTIALLCYFAQYRNDWGPHLIVVPTTVVLNWKDELQRWAPGLKLVTYIGSLKERLQHRKGWMKEDAFHICITTYNVLVNDRAVFRRRPWGFLVLDEAHQIKNFMSKKWLSLFDLQVSYRLLLTGTPLQNSIMELWSLFHFLLPFASAFRSHEEFKEWFSNPLDDMVAGRTALNETIVRRLQALLRPFMLRRLKRDVESQLPTKTEKVVRCNLSRRQRALYDDYMQLSDTRRRILKGGVFSVLLALRKVCDHPDLFEERPTLSPLVLDRSSAIVYHAPRLVLLQGNCFRYTFPMPQRILGSTAQLVVLDMNDTHRRHRASASASASSSPAFDWLPCQWLRLRFVFQSMKEELDTSRLSPLYLSAPTGTAWPTPSPGAAGSGAPPLSDGLLWSLQLGCASVLHASNVEARSMTRHCQAVRQRMAACSTVYVPLPRALLDDPPVCVTQHAMQQVWWEHHQDLCPSIPDRLTAAWPLLQQVAVYVPRAVTAVAPQLVCSLPLRRPSYFQHTGQQYAPLIAHTRREAERRSFGRAPRSAVYDGSNFLAELWPLHVRRCFSFPDKRLLIHDCGKLQYLARALKQLRAEGHRVLIFTQFVRMLDILERFLALIGVAYLRLDGATKAEDRQFSVHRFNMDDRITAMILSTRSGGIGLNLTGADTVIFYDSDWNPTMDLQAQDRCHRIGQTRPVTIYRLISAHTVEESILEKSRERKRLNNVVIRGGQFNAIAGVGEADGAGDSAAAMALLTMKTDLRAFFQDSDEDIDMHTTRSADETTPADADLLREMKGAEDAEDRAALEQLEAELQDRAKEDAVDGDEDTAAPASVDWVGDAAGEAGEDDTPPLQLYKTEPALLETVRRRQQQLLQKARSELDATLTRNYGLFHPRDARRRYEELAEQYAAKIALPGAELPPFQRREVVAWPKKMKIGVPEASGGGLFALVVPQDSDFLTFIFSITFFLCLLVEGRSARLRKSHTATPYFNLPDLSLSLSIGICLLLYG